MKRNCLVLIFLFMLLLTAGAFAQNDISIKFNGGGTDLWYGMENHVEFWWTTAEQIDGFSLSFVFTSTQALPFSWKTPYGNMPKNPAPKYVQEFNDAVGAFDMTGLLLVTTQLPLKFTLAGSANANSLPANAVSRMCYDMVLILPSGAGTFTMAPSFIGPSGYWKWVGLVNTAIRPTFNGLTVLNADTQNPTLAGGPIQVPIVLRPCAGPAFTLPATATHSHSGSYTNTLTATPGDAAWTGWSTSVGTIVGPITAGVLTVPGVCPSQGPTTVTVSAINACPATTTHDIVITWTNQPPVIYCPPVDGNTVMTADFTQNFFAHDDDQGDSASMTWSAVCTVSPAVLPSDTTYSFDGNQFKFKSQVSGDFTFTITAEDPCLAVGTCTFTVKVAALRFNIVEIPKMGENPNFVYQGTYTTVPVKMGLTLLELAGYNLLVHYDASALSFVSATIGPDFGPCPNGSGWEYFTYRFGSDGNCGGPCPSGLLRVIALAETNNGPNHPGCPNPFGVLTKDPYAVSGKVLANLKFYVTNDRTFECQYSEIGFAWLECGDNSFSDPTGNRLYIAGRDAVHTFEWNRWDFDLNLIPCEVPVDTTGATAIFYGGFCPIACLNQSPILGKPQPIDSLFFMNGGIDIACADSIDARGDINLNGISNEIADAVLFTNFFLKGISAFSPIQQTRQGMIAATDVNNDGRVLTVGDLVYLLRIIVGDALPYTKLSPFASAATVNFAGGSVSTESGSEIGAVYATFAINGAYNVVSNTNMQVESGEVNGELKVLVYSGMSNLSNRIASGTNELFTVSGNVELKSVEVADYSGNMLNTRVSKTSLPTSFTLSQNVPNPFNPTTKLGFALPNQTEWTLSIYNVAGQLVKNFSGNNIGNVSVEWDASMAPSGVYFYKLNAGTYSDTKKMVLMK